MQSMTPMTDAEVAAFYVERLKSHQSADYPESAPMYQTLIDALVAGPPYSAEAVGEAWDWFRGLDVSGQYPGLCMFYEDLFEYMDARQREVAA